MSSVQAPSTPSQTTTSTNPFGAVLNKNSALRRRMSSPHGDIAKTEAIVNKQLTNLEGTIKDAVKKNVVKFGNDFNNLIENINKNEDSSGEILKENLERETELLKKLEEVGKENEELKKQVEKLTKENRSKSDEFESKDSTIEKLLKRATEREKELNDTKDLLRQKNQKISFLENIHSEILKNASKEEKFKLSYIDSETKRMELENEVSEMKRSLESIQAEQGIKASGKRFQNQLEVQNLERERDNLEKQVQSLLKQCKDTERQRDACKKIAAEANDKVTRMEATLKECEDKRVKAVEETMKRSTELKNSAQKIKELETKFALSEQKIQDIEDLTLLSKLNEEEMKGTGSVEQLRRLHTYRQNKLEKANSSSSVQLRILEKEHNALRMNYDLTMMEVSNLLDLNQSLTAQLKELKDGATPSNTEEWKILKQEEKSELENIQTIQKLKEEIERLKEENAKSNNAVDIKLMEISSFKEQIDEMKSRFQHLSTEAKSDYEAYADRERTLLRNMDSCEQDIEAKKKEIAKLNSTVDKLKQEITEVTTTMAEKIEQVKEQSKKEIEEIKGQSEKRIEEIKEKTSKEIEEIKIQSDKKIEEITITTSKQIEDITEQNRQLQVKSDLNEASVNTDSTENKENVDDLIKSKSEIESELSALNTQLQKVSSQVKEMTDLKEKEKENFDKMIIAKKQEMRVLLDEKKRNLEEIMSLSNERLKIEGIVKQETEKLESIVKQKNLVILSQNDVNYEPQQINIDANEEFSIQGSKDDEEVDEFDVIQTPDHIELGHEKVFEEAGEEAEEEQHADDDICNVDLPNQEVNESPYIGSSISQHYEPTDYTLRDDEHEKEIEKRVKELQSCLSPDYALTSFEDVEQQLGREAQTNTTPLSLDYSESIEGTPLTPMSSNLLSEEKSLSEKKDVYVETDVFYEIKPTTKVTKFEKLFSQKWNEFEEDEHDYFLNIPSPKTARKQVAYYEKKYLHLKMKYRQMVEELVRFELGSRQYKQRTRKYKEDLEASKKRLVSLNKEKKELEHELKAKIRELEKRIKRK